MRAAAIRQEIAPQTISTKDVYQSKHMMAAQIGAVAAHSRPDSSKTSENLKLNVIVMNMGFNNSYYVP